MICWCMWFECKEKLMLSPYFGGRVASLIGLWRRKKKEKTTRLNICVVAKRPRPPRSRRPQATVVGVEAMLPNLSRWNFLCCSTLRDNFSSFGWLPEVRKSAASDNNASILCVHKSSGFYTTCSKSLGLLLFCNLPQSIRHLSSALQ